LAQCQFKVTGWDIMFICGMVADLTTIVIHIALNF